MKILFGFFAICLLFVAPAQAQRYGTRTAKIHFFAGTPIENIEATNNTASAVIDWATGKVEFATLVKSFKFDRALMEEHFNENYMESNTFPKSTFSGTVDLSGVNLKKDGVYNVSATGKHTMHGVTKTITVPGSITVVKGVPTLKAVFNVKPEDYNIEIPGAVRDKIAKTIKIDLVAELAAM